MSSYHNILDKLNQFTKRHYTKILIKGVLLFLSFGLLFFLVIIGVEYFLWLSSSGRLTLLLIVVLTELFLLFKYILTPLFYLFKLRKGISNKQASLLIGKHFPEVGDKLYNLLDLAEDTNTSELLLASIEQRSNAMKLIPFVKAVDFRENLKYSKYLVIPIVIVALVWLSGNISSFFGSYERVVNYDLAYEAPAPFSFELLSNDLNVLESESYTINVTTAGSIQPENVFIVINGKESLLQEEAGIYSYTLVPPLKDASFYFKGNEVRSKEYQLRALRTPAIQNFSIVLDYPNYTKKPTETLISTGNATFPEGTKVSWNITSDHTEEIALISKDTILNFIKERTDFKLNKRIYSDFSYQLATSNENVKHYETLDYSFKVIRDGYPAITAKQVLDSLNPNVTYFVGEASDDYLLASIKIVCYSDEETDKKQIVELIRPNANFEQFYYTFPSGLELDTDKNYSFYFEATDNDAIHKGKTTKSQIFSLALLNDNQLKNKELESQQSLINKLDNSLEKFKEQKETLKEINREQKEKDNLSFNDKNQVKDFLKKQQQQEKLRQKFSKELRDNLEKGNKDDELNKLLKERLERQELEAKKNEKLLEELKKVADKINKEELAKRLEELGKKQQNSERGLEQLLELTKRYYVTEKAAQLAKDLEKLAEQQKALSEESLDSLSSKKQKKLNEKFKELSKELEELEKDNEDLKKPLDLNIDGKKEEAIKEDQKEALEELDKEKEEQENKENPEKANKKESASAKKQKAAAQKIQEMSGQLQESSAGGGGSSITEDSEMLRQILDNLISFSFKQENLYDSLEESDLDIARFSSSVRKQQELRNLFEHIDDSLFALSLRRAELAEFVNEQITEVYYNTDKALENLAERQIYQGVGSQQRILNASNSLANFLANVLDNMQSSSQSGQGQGEGKGFQLPDIIKAQGELQKKLGEKGEKGEQGKEGKEGKGEQGKSGEKGKEGEGGESGKDGKKGEGSDGQSGEGGQGGENGKSKGKDGKGNGEGNGEGTGELSEQELKEIYEIYKEQQQLREQLEQQLENFIEKEDSELAKKLVRQMEDFENDLLENGITQRTINKANTIQYELLKLENAALKQGKKQDRESTSNTNRFRNPITTKPPALDDYRNETEILNRQALPLRQNFQNKVKEYFKNND